MAAQLPPKKIMANGEGGLRRDPRVSYILRDEDKLFQCPYDPSHFVLQERVASHLTKCRHNHINARKNNKNIPRFEVCIYNFTHHVLEDEMEEHKKTCPSHLKVQEEERRNPTCFSQFVKKTEPPVSDANDADAAACDDEDWDAEMAAKPAKTVDKRDRFADYNPLSGMKEKKFHMITNPQGLTKSEREKYRGELLERAMAEQEEEQPIVPKHVPQRRSGNAPVGFPGYDPNPAPTPVIPEEAEKDPGA